MTLVIALMSLVLMSSLATSLVVVANTEQRAAANYAGSREAMYAADGALHIAARELMTVVDWNALLSNGALSSFVDGVPGGVRQLGDGSTLDPIAATALANGESRPWGANNPVWRLFAFGWLGSRTYVLAWVADDSAENDGDPSVDGGGLLNPGAGVLAVRAEAFGVGGAHKVLECTVRREVDAAGTPVTRMASWHEIRY